MGRTSRGPQRPRTKEARRWIRNAAAPALLLGSFLLPFSFLLLLDPQSAHSIAGVGPAGIHGGIGRHGRASAGITIAEDDVLVEPSPSQPASVQRTPSESSSDSLGPNNEGAPSRPPRKATSRRRDHEGSRRRGSRAVAVPSTPASRCSNPQCPVVTSLSSDHGPTSGGTRITIYGRNLGSPQTLSGVTVGDVPCAEVRSLSAASATCVVPAGTGKALPVSVDVLPAESKASVPGATPEDGEGEGEGAALWSYDPPAVFRVEPSHAPRRGGTRIVIVGANFGARESFPQAFVGAASCLRTEWLADDRVACVVPPGSGVGLRVRVVVCGCTRGAGQEASQLPWGPEHVQASGGGGGGGAFSYDEDAVGSRDGSRGVARGLDLGPQGPLGSVPVAMALPLVDQRQARYEMRFDDVFSAEETRGHFFAVVPELVRALPARDALNDRQAARGGRGGRGGGGGSRRTAPARWLGVPGRSSLVQVGPRAAGRWALPSATASTKATRRSASTTPLRLGSNASSGAKQPTRF